MANNPFKGSGRNESGGETTKILVLFVWLPPRVLKTDRNTQTYRHTEGRMYIKIDRTSPGWAGIYR